MRSVRSIVFYIAAVLLPALAPQLSAQSLCPELITYRSRSATAGYSQSPGTGVAGRLTKDDVDDNFFSFEELICKGLLEIDALATSCSDGEVVKASSGALVCASDNTGAGGSAIILDLADDASNESTDITEIATTGDTNSIFTEPAADKLLIDLGQNWPTADLAVFTDPDSNFAATDVAAAVAELDDVNGSGPNAADGKVEWSQLVGVPAGFADGTDDGGGGGTPGGSDSQVQFNDGGAFGGDAGLIFNKTSNDLTVVGGNLGVKSADAVPNYQIDMGTALGKKLAVYSASGGTGFYGLGIESLRMQQWAQDVLVSELWTDGDMSIGMSSGSNPGARLHIQTAADAVLTVETTDAGDAELSIKNSAQEWEIGTYGTEGANRFMVADRTGGTFPLVIEPTAANNALQIDSTGAVIVNDTGGATTPLGQLHIVGDAHVTEQLEFPATIGDKIELYGATFGLGVSSSETSFWLPNSAGHHWSFRTGSRTGTEVAQLDYLGNLQTDGDVTVSAATTESRHVRIGNGRSGNGYAGLDLIGDATYTTGGLSLLRYNTGANARSEIGHRGTGNLDIVTYELGDLRWLAGATQVLIMDSSSGYVGVGSDATPDANFEVNGLASGAVFKVSSDNVGDGDYVEVEQDGDVLFRTGTLEVTTKTIFTGVGLDAVGAVDLDYGSADVTDHTFITDGTGTAEIVLPAGSIDSSEILDGTIVEADLAAGSVTTSKIASGTCDTGACTVGTDDTVTLAQSTNPTPTAEGRIQWDTDDDRIVVGDGSGQKIFYAGPVITSVTLTIASGDVTLPVHTLPRVWDVTISPESGTADDLDHILGGVTGDRVHVTETTVSDAITTKHNTSGTGRLNNLLTAADYTLGGAGAHISYRYRAGSVWDEVTRK